MLPLHKTPDSRSARHQALLKPDNNPSESAVSAHGNSNDLPTCTWVLLKRKLFFSLHFDFRPEKHPPGWRFRNAIFTVYIRAGRKGDFWKRWRRNNTEWMLYCCSLYLEWHLVTLMMQWWRTETKTAAQKSFLLHLAKRLTAIHTYIHWWRWLPCKAPTGTSGAVWG